MKPKLINITCKACSTPLFAFEQTQEQAQKGEMSLRSFGAAMRFPQDNPKIALAVCPKCRGETPFNRSLLPG